MPKNPLVVVGMLVAWVLWCVFVIQILVPAIQRHVTIWAQAIALVGCLAPAFLVGAILIFRVKKATDQT